MTTTPATPGAPDADHKSPPAPDSATQAQSVMKQFSKTDFESDGDDQANESEARTAPGTQAKSSEPNHYKTGESIDRPGSLTPHAGSPAEKTPSDGGAP